MARICPQCGTVNENSAHRCIECGYRSLQENTDIEPEPTESADPGDGGGSPPEKPSTTAPSAPMRKCPSCGTLSPFSQRKCQCGADLSNALIVGSGVPKAIDCSLVAVDGTVSLDLTKPLYTLGREAELSEYLSDKDLVSRQHAKLSVTSKGIYVTDVGTYGTGSTSGTFVNGKNIGKDSVCLHDGDALGLGGSNPDDLKQWGSAYFTVRDGRSCM
jgi:hypothetical protein